MQLPTKSSETSCQPMNFPHLIHQIATFLPISNHLLEDTSCCSSTDTHHPPFHSPAQTSFYSLSHPPRPHAPKPSNKAYPSPSPKRFDFLHSFNTFLRTSSTLLALSSILSFKSSAHTSSDTLRVFFINTDLHNYTFINVPALNMY